MWATRRIVTGPVAKQMFNNARLPAMRSFAAVGDKFPTVDVDFGFPPTKVNLGDKTKGKKVIVVGLPGAFTPV